MPMAQNNDIKFKDADYVLRKNGFVRERVKGSHFYYTRDSKSVVINIRTNRMVWRRICKENGLII